MKRSRATVVWSVVRVAVGIFALTSSLHAQGKWTAPATAAPTKNPVAKSEKVMAQTKKTFEQSCASCHGPKGLGDGAAAATLPVKPANWTTPDIQKQSDGEIFWKISEGRGPMPPWKTILSENDRWAMVHFIRTFKK